MSKFNNIKNQIVVRINFYVCYSETRHLHTGHGIPEINLDRSISALCCIITIFSSSTRLPYHTVHKVVCNPSLW